MDVHRKTAEQYLQTITSTPDFVVVDPPRAGLGKVVVAELLRAKPRQLTIVSCDPSTLARDLMALVGGGYKVEAITLVDLFPQTAHLETVVRLTAA